MNQNTIEHFSPCASLCALAPKIVSLKLFETISEHLFIKQKTIKHKPIDKLKDAFISILAGAHGLCEINNRLRSDVALPRAFGRPDCAEQSVVQETLNACSVENVAQMQRAFNLIFRKHSRAYRHDYRRKLQLLDIDTTGMRCGKKSEMSHKGYFANAGIRYGRQLGRVVATHYQEIVVDQLFSGNAKLSHALRPIIIAAEEVMQLDEKKRSRTVLRMDAGGGSLDDVNWVLGRGYQLHGKDWSSVRAKNWAATVKQWFDDPNHSDRQMGWAEPITTTDYIRPVRRLVIRWTKENNQRGYAMLISTLEPDEVMRLLNKESADMKEGQMVAAAYAQLYDKRGGAIEIEIKEDKQGCGLGKRQKKRGAAQQMVVMLNALAHNVLVWAREWMSEQAPKLKRYGTLRLVRDVLSVSGRLELNKKTGAIKRIVLNRAAPILTGLLTALRGLLLPQHASIILGEI
ncbi:MAG TPA: transposase [Blastocatellia bacterium]|nr:transposase [Blastocatellia bacterium]